MLDWSVLGKGMLSGIVSRIVIEPFDLVKIRMELNESKVPAGLLTTLSSIYNREGLLAFWKGNVFGVWLYMSYTGVQFFTYENLSVFNLGPFCRGMISGVTATCISYPFDMLRTRSAVRSNAPISLNNTVEMIKSVKQFEGFVGYWKGIGPTLLSMVPAAGISFWAFNCSNRFLCKIMGRSDDNNVSVNLISGAVAGAISKLATMPLDVLRKRMQVQSPKRHEFVIVNSKYQNMFAATNDIFIREGIRGFYKGLVVALLKTIPATAITFASFYAFK